jgi:hypothetical protein
MFAARGGFQYYQTSGSGSFGNNLDVTPNVSFVYTPGSGTTPTGMIDWTATTGFTVEYWVYTTSWPGSISPGPGNQDGGVSFPNYLWNFGPANNGQLIFYCDNGSGNYIRTANSALTLNTWYNIAAVCTTTAGTTTVTLYINGVRQSVSLNSGSFANSQNVSGGVINTSIPFGFGRVGANYLNSYMDNLRVSNINRYSGASYSVATSPFTLDSNTQLLIEPTGSVGSTTIAYQSTLGNGNMVNSFNFVTVTNAHFNHS